MKCLILSLLICAACTPSSTTIFQPTKQQDWEKEQLKQLGLPEIRSGMDCREYYEIMLELCYSYIDCSPRQMRGYQRDLSRVNKTSICKVYFGNDARIMLRGR